MNIICTHAARVHDSVVVKNSTNTDDLKLKLMIAVFLKMSGLLPRHLSSPDIFRLSLLGARARAPPRANTDANDLTRVRPAPARTQASPAQGQRVAMTTEPHACDSGCSLSSSYAGAHWNQRNSKKKSKNKLNADPTIIHAHAHAHPHTYTHMPCTLV